MDTKNFKFIRGARLLQWAEEDETLEEVTLSDLERDTVSGFPNTTKRQHATDPVQITQMKLVPARPTGDLICDATAKSGPKTYDPKILFLDTTFEDEDTRTNVTFTAVDGDAYNIQPISLTRSNCKVTCNCLDFHYRFNNTNADKSALYGRPNPPYQPKPDSNRPSVNPNKVGGLCKHLISTIQALRQSGLVVS
jgi:hypothetical protein